MQINFHNKKLCTQPHFHNEVQSNSEMTHYKLEPTYKDLGGGEGGVTQKKLYGEALP